VKIMGWYDELSEATKIAVMVVIVLAIVSLGIFTIQAALYPGWLSIQRSGVEHSKSFIDSQNTAMQNLIREYNGNQTNEGQQQAILAQLCQMTNSMKADTVAPNINQFIAVHGGCQ
jgi:uncharacterized ion transporter superfamily protein YfcC